MTPADLKAIRQQFGYTKPMMADRIGLSLRAYEEIEAGRSEIRTIHINAIKWVQTNLAWEAGKPELLPEEQRQQPFGIRGDH